MNLYNANLAEVREGQNSRKDSTVALREAGVSQHSVKVHNTLVFQGTQWPVRNSSLNLPDRSLAWVVAFSTHHGLALQDLNMVWQAVIPRNSVLRYFREERAAAWDLNLFTHYFRTADLHILLTFILVGCEVSHAEGCRQSCPTLQNQDLEEEDAGEKMERNASPECCLHLSTCTVGLAQRTF